MRAVDVRRRHHVAALADERRRMPWLALEKEYAFEGPDGWSEIFDRLERTLAQA
jgi:predicted dithiol-disulfide oxidoreductase (DUF899 family)